MLVGERTPWRVRMTTSLSCLEVGCSAGDDCALLNGAIKMRAHNSLATMKAPEPEAGGAQNSGFGSDIITAIIPRQSYLHSGIIRTPVRDGFLDVRATQLFIDRALEESRQLSVRGKAQPDDLGIGQFTNT